MGLILFMMLHLLHPKPNCAFRRIISMRIKVIFQPVIDEKTVRKRSKKRFMRLQQKALSLEDLLISEQG